MLRWSWEGGSDLYEPGASVRLGCKERFLSGEERFSKGLGGLRVTPGTVPLPPFLPRHDSSPTPPSPSVPLPLPLLRLYENAPP